MLRRLRHGFSWRLYIAGDLRSHSYVRLLHEISPETLEPPSSSNSDFTVLYLTNSCGLSPVAALSAANKLRLKATGNADSILDLLKNYGFTGNEITKLVTRYPRILSMNFEKIIKPKLEIFLSAGLSTATLRKVITTSPGLLASSLEKRLKPNLNLLKTIFGDANDVTRAICGASAILWTDEYGNGYLRNMLTNMKTLEEYGVPRQRLIKKAAAYIRAFVQCPTKFSEGAAFLKKRGFDPLKRPFILGIVMICGLSRSTRKRKLQLYRSLGWPEKDINLLLKYFPFCLSCSEEKIKQVTSFYVEKLKWKHSFVAVRSKFFTVSFDKTIIPRNNVFDILESKGLVRRKYLSAFLLVSEKKFLDRYVIKYGEQFPEVLEAYKIKLDFLPGKSELID